MSGTNKSKKAPKRTILSEPCSHDLSEIAEMSDGFRDRFVDVYKEGDTLTSKPRADTATSAPPGVLFSLKTASKRPNRKKALAVVVPVAVDDDSTNVDAVFLTESAVEKFVWPYYTAARIHASEVAALRDLYYGIDKSDNNADNIVGIAHTYPSRPDAIVIDGGLRLAVRVSLRPAEEPQVVFLTAAQYKTYLQTL